MRNRTSVFIGGCVLAVAIAATTPTAQKAPTQTTPPATPTPVSSHATQTPAPKPAAAAVDHNAVVRRYCVTCHNEKRKDQVLGLVLENFDVTKATQHAEVAEKMIRKLQAGMMPPPGSARPDAATLAALTTTLETQIDAAAVANPNPGRRTFQRLNRAEYARAIRELLALNVNAGDWLPLDTMSANFDNVADEQALSPTLLEAYLNAASDISRLAIGDRHAPAVDRVYRTPIHLSQHPWDTLEGAPYGTRGGIVVDHVFPADAEYVFEVTFESGSNSRHEDVDISLGGERIALIKWENLGAGGADGRGAAGLRTEPISIKAGQHKIAAAFVKKLEGPYEDLIRPHEWSYAGGGSGGAGITTLPHIRDLVISGPYNVTGVSQSPTRQKIFSCRPTLPSEERTCARQIISRIGHEAYRRPLSSAEVDRLMPFFEKGATKGGFEIGVRSALEAILASPYFIFRLEREPDTAKTGGTYRVTDLDLASRLSFFLWGTPPDKDLLMVASKGELSKPGGLERQARRMLADPRAEALGSRFAGQWLRLQDLDKVKPDPNFYPNFDDNLAALMRKETELFFNNLVKEDASLLELYRAKYTFVNERLARHYGFPGVAGNQFRRYDYPNDSRLGVLGQGSMLVQTSYANRTSPVLRGKWVMEVLLGTPPPPPPPDVPDLDATAEAKGGKLLTTRERMEMHRTNPTCNSCHRFIDPIGLALDNFDVTAKWREREYGNTLDTRGNLYDGTAISTPAELSAALLKRPVPLVRTFTENLLAYALGRRIEHFDQPAIRAISRKAAVDGYKMSSFILGVVTSDAFRLKRTDAGSVATEVAAK